MIVEIEKDPFYAIVYLAHVRNLRFYVPLGRNRIPYNPSAALK